MIEPVIMVVTRPSDAVADSHDGRHNAVAADDHYQEWIAYLMPKDHAKRIAEHARRVGLDEARRRRQRIQSGGGARTICGTRVKIWCEKHGAHRYAGLWRWRVVGKRSRGFAERAEAIRDAARVLSGAMVAREER